jgi:glyoxylase-like metal-dependent hydrolase (beta-lactamase superfamily II)
MLEWKIGNVRISCVPEVVLDLPSSELLPDFRMESLGSERAWIVPDHIAADGMLKVAVQTFVVESEGKVILVDTCFGNDRDLPYEHMEPLQTSFLEDIAGVGAARDAVDVVLCTHLHFDHVGWNTMLVDGAWVPTFPNAEYLFGQAEYEHWQDHDDFNIDLTDNVEPVIAAGLHRFVAMDHRITGEVALRPTPGHTPGHASLAIESGGQRALITGDMIHNPVQVAHPDLAALPDWDADAARATRRAVLEDIAGHDVLLLGTHFAAPTGGYVRRESDASLRFDVA